MKSKDILAKMEELEGLPDRGREELKFQKEQIIASYAVAYQLAVFNEQQASQKQELLGLVGKIKHKE